MEVCTKKNQNIYDIQNIFLIIKQRLQRLMGAGGLGSMSQPGVDTPTFDTAEMVHISSLALLKMLKHGKPFIYIYKINIKYKRY